MTTFPWKKKYVEEQLLERFPGFNMAAFTTTLSTKVEVADDVFDMLTFTDFLAFTDFLDYGAEKKAEDLSSGLVVISLCKSSSEQASKNCLPY